MKKLFRFLGTTLLLFFLTTICFSQKSGISKAHSIHYQYECKFQDRGIWYRYRWNPATPGDQWGTTNEYDIDTYDNAVADWTHHTHGTGGNAWTLQSICQAVEL